MCGVNKVNDYFKFDWEQNTWNLIFIRGTIIGGFIANQYLMPNDAVHLAESTVKALEGLGFESPGATFESKEVFTLDFANSWRTILMLIAVIGFFIGGLSAVRGLFPLIFK